MNNINMINKLIKTTNQEKFKTKLKSKIILSSSFIILSAFASTILINSSQAQTQKTGNANTPKPAVTANTNTNNNNNINNNVILDTINPINLNGNVNNSNGNGNSASNVNSSNTVNNDEKTLDGELVPIFKDYAKQRSILSLKELRKKIKEIDKDTSKLDVKLNTNDGSSPVITPEQNEALLKKLQQPQVISQNSMNKNNMQNNQQDVSDNAIRVFSIYGFSDKLTAKVGIGEQGGYPVEKGDILPNGRIVQDVQLNFIVVAPSKKGQPAERIFVAEKQNVVSPTKQMGNQSSAIGNVNVPPGTQISGVAIPGTMPPSAAGNPFLSIIPTANPVPSGMNK